MSSVTRISDLSNGHTNISVKGIILEITETRTFNRNDGSQGQVANIALKDATGSIKIAFWDTKTELLEQYKAGETVTVTNLSANLKDEELELYSSEGTNIRLIEEKIDITTDATPISDTEIDDSVDLAGYVVETNDKRTFDRDNGSTGQVRNISIKDDTGEIRLALWGEKADKTFEPGDQIFVGSAEIQEGWKGGKEGSVGWQSSILITDRAQEIGGRNTGLSRFSEGKSEQDGSDQDSSDNSTTDESENTEYTGVVIEKGGPIKIKTKEGTETVSSSKDVTLGTEITVRGEKADDGTIEPKKII